MKWIEFILNTHNVLWFSHICLLNRAVCNIKNYRGSFKYLNILMVFSKVLEIVDSKNIIKHESCLYSIYNNAAKFKQLISFFRLLLFNCICHQFLLGAFGAYNIFCVSDEAFTNHRCFTRWTNKTVVVPMSTLKGYKSSTSNTYAA